MRGGGGNKQHNYTFQTFISTTNAQPMGMNLFKLGVVSNPTTPFIYNMSRCVSRSTLYTSGLTECSIHNPQEQASAGTNNPAKNLLRHRQHGKRPASARQIPLLGNWSGATIPPPALKCYQKGAPDKTHQTHGQAGKP